MTTRSKRQQGFSLIELLIVVAIMLVIAAIAIPAAIAAKQSGNEAAVGATMKALITAENGFANLYPGTGYSAKAAALDMGTGCPATPPSTAPTGSAVGAGACFLQNGVADNLDSGTATTGYTYAFATASAGKSWSETAIPNGASGGRKSFCADYTGNITYAVGATAPPAVADLCTTGTPLGQ